MKNLLVALAASGMLVACDKAPEAQPKAAAPGPLSGKVTIDGSSTLFPLSKAMSEAFRETNSGVQFAIDQSSTGAGLKKLCAGQLDIADASRPINAEEIEQCKAQKIEYLEVPVAFDSLAVVVNAKNTFVDCLTVKELKAVWEPAAEGKTKQWSQVRAAFPAQPLALFGTGKDSGTYDYFTLAVVGTQGSSRSDYAKSQDHQAVEKGVAGDPNALGFVGYAYYEANKDQVKLVGVDNGQGCVVPSAQTVAESKYQPLSRPLFVYVSATAAARPEVQAFTRFYLAPDSTKHVTKVGYVPLPNSSLVAQASRLEKRVTGSTLGGHGAVVGVSLYSFDEKERDRIRSALVQ